MKRLTLSIALCLAASSFSVLQAQRPGGQGQGGRSGGPGGGGRGPGGQGMGGQGMGGQGRSGPQQMSPLMRIFDTDQDGELSAAEIQNSASALLKLDKDGDGKLTAQEMRPSGQAGSRGQGGQRGGGAGQGRSGPQGQSQRGGPSGGGGPGGGGARGGNSDAAFASEVLSFDANKDGLLSLAELPEHMHKAFAIADANGNGSLDADERLVFAGQFGRKKLQPGGENLEMKNRPTQGRRQ